MLKHLSPFLALSLCLVGNSPAMADCGRDCEIAAAQAYIDALLSHDASQVPLADDVQRVEQGKITASGADDLRQGLDKDLRYRVITGIRDEQYIVDGDEVMVLYTIDTLQYGNKGRQIASSRTFERFRVVNGLIGEIEVVFKVLAGRYEVPAWPDRTE